MAAWEQPGFIASIIGQDGKPIREHNEGGFRVTRIPFGSEYKIRLQNKSALRALVGVEIDGTNVTAAGKIILHAGESVDLERFLENLNGGAKFKFVEASNSAVQDPTAKENGRIRVTFEGEQFFTTTYTPPIQPFSTGVLRGMGGLSGLGAGFINNVYSCNSVGGSGGTGACMNSSSTIMAKSDAGATIDGGHSSQQFSSSSESFAVCSPVYLDIWLKGLQPVLYNIVRTGTGISINGTYFPNSSVTVQGNTVCVTSQFEASTASVRL